MAGADDLDWDDLRYFLRAVRAGTLAGAARAIGVEHTTIGRRLTALERALGAPLVLRGPEGLSLTPLGEKLVPLVDDIERNVAAVKELVASQRARVRLAVPSGFTKFLAPGVARFAQQHPGLSLELVSGARPVDLARGEADLAIRTGAIGKDLVARRLFDSGWSLYAAESYLARRPPPSNPEHLAGHDVVGFDTTLANVPPAKWLEQHGAGANIVLRSREMTDMLTAVVSGVGIAVLPCHMGDEEPGVRRLTTKVLAWHTFSLVCRREARLRAEVRAVVRFVVDTIGPQAARLAGVQAAK